MTNIILCGGVGTRLWPLSRTLMPKQFVNLLGEDSLFSRTLKRNLPACDTLLVVTNVDQWFLAADAVDALPLDDRPSSLSFLLEPVGRNTAPAIAMACMELDPGEIVLVSPSDQLISDEAMYRERIAAARVLAEKGYLVTFGMAPAYPETGFGYIEIDPGKPLGGDACFAVRSFKEKPDATTAAGYLASGNFLWNSGMFVFKAGAFLEELARTAPAIFAAAKAAIAGAKRSHDAKRNFDSALIATEAMKAIPADSVDYAVMERSDRVACVRSSFGWSDVGSFDALFDVSPKDADGNSTGAGFLGIGARNNLVLGDHRTIACVGIENLLVVDTGDALLIARRGRSQDVKAVVDRLKGGSESERELCHAHLTVRRPWGSYTILDEGPGFKVKRIVVTPGSKLSLQKHARRSERWVVAGGVPVITIDERREAHAIGDVAQIPVGSVHRLENEGDVDAIIIETQLGDYLGEDDIVRLEDVYGRK
ncbi:MAG: mannose-1-phosphate guanylyltransferase/mannose-6-phosphate isomerase [Spirochaetales bacterium]|nr:MAG: mannose-1-phosphate guanylyltransferase/mannose-6-phosphate isomerase [Spirochaetales bacterium]